MNCLLYKHSADYSKCSKNISRWYQRTLVSLSKRKKKKKVNLDLFRNESSQYFILFEMTWYSVDFYHLIWNVSEFRETLLDGFFQNRTNFAEFNQEVLMPAIFT